MAALHPLRHYVDAQGAQGAGRVNVSSPVLHALELCSGIGMNARAFDMAKR